jgi:hypothetical protein
MRPTAVGGDTERTGGHRHHDHEGDQERSCRRVGVPVPGRVPTSPAGIATRAVMCAHVGRLAA